ncbi:MAG: amidase [Frankiales bacterium]|nr:amidase [Frankiales bacterium]
MADDPRTWSVDALTLAFRSGVVSPVEATRAALDRIARVDPVVNAFVWVDGDDALEQARASEERWRAGTPRSPIDGVPTTVKDLLPWRGRPTRKGSVHTSTEPATEEAPTVERLREAGAVVLGATTTPEFGWKGGGDSPLTGITRNPWDTSRTTGGSSAGAAAAAATGMGVLHVGTDGGGSVRMPSAFCGVFGLKPTHSVVPIHPAAVSGLLSHVGPITRHVRDAAHLMAAIARPDHRDVYPSQLDGRSWIEGLDDGVRGLRVAFTPTWPRAQVDPQVADAVRRTVDVLAGLGAEVDEVEAPGADVRDAFLALWDGALGRALRGLPPEALERSDPGLVATTRRRESLSADAFLDADAVRAESTLRFSTLLTRYDVLVSPTVPVQAFPVGQDVADPSTQEHWIDWTPFTYPVNMTRHPAAAVPVGLSTEGLPLSMQVVGRHFDDRLVLRVAQAVQTAQPWELPPL